MSELNPQTTQASEQINLNASSASSEDETSSAAPQAAPVSSPPERSQPADSTTRKNPPRLALAALFLAVAATALQCWLGPATMTRQDVLKNSNAIERLRLELRVARARLTTEDPLDDYAVKGDLANYLWYHNEKDRACQLFEEVLESKDPIPGTENLKYYYYRTHNLQGLARLADIEAKRTASVTDGYDRVAILEDAAQLHRKAGDAVGTKRLLDAAEVARQIPAWSIEDLSRTDKALERYLRLLNWPTVGGDNARASEAWLALGLRGLESNNPGRAHRFASRVIGDDHCSPSQRNRARILSFVASFQAHDLPAAAAELQPAQAAADALAPDRESAGRYQAMFAHACRRYLIEKGDLEAANQMAEKEVQARNLASGPLLRKVSVPGEE